MNQEDAERSQGSGGEATSESTPANGSAAGADTDRSSTAPKNATAHDGVEELDADQAEVAQEESAERTAEEEDGASSDDTSSSSLDFPVVGIGASAGGLQAFENFFDSLPKESGMAFVLVQHLDPHHESELAQLLQNHTRMKVTQVEGQTEVQQNKVYVIPPGKSLTIKNGTLHLSEPDKPRGQRAAIDAFLRSLAADCRDQAVCIILSGTGSDGTLGLKSIKEYGGLVMAQDPKEAEYDGMPRSAVTTGLVDLIAPAAELGQRLMEYRKTANRIQLPDTDTLPEDEPQALSKIFAQLRTHTGHDFTHYKRSTILRRIQRRMQVRQIEDMSSYLEFLRGNQEEIDALFKDFLISVTNFFRDPEAFEVLEQEAIPEIFERKGTGDRVRVWVPGCATGEEAYSIAMLILEEASRRDAAPEIQVFASDLDEDALAFARAGLYPDTIATDISPDRLNRNFSKEDRGYRVKKRLKDVVLFAHHNLIKDPPFSKQDLISCRNVLIYLNRDVQERIFELFQYALRERGFLFLGGSETADGVKNMFSTVSKRHRLYRRRRGPTHLPQMPIQPASMPEENRSTPKESEEPPALSDVHRNLILEAYGPPSVMVDADYEIRHFFGDVGQYMRRTEGFPTDNILENVAPDLRLELRTALFQVFNKGQRIDPRRVRLDDRSENVMLHVRPVERKGEKDRLALVVFEPLPEPEDSDGDEEHDRDYDTDLIEQLEGELQSTRHRLQTVIEEYETSNEELKASNEELQSTNEELRSTTEELETSKEELQSTNEELHTVNAELKTKIEELSEANSDLQNLMQATDIATVFLDRELRLKLYTPRAGDLFNVIAADVGRPFAHISHHVERDNLAEVAKNVLDNLSPHEEEVTDEDGNWYIMRVLPYRTVEDRIDGIVITFVDITEQKEYQQQVASREQQQSVVAEIGQRALQGVSLQGLMEKAVVAVNDTLGVDFVKVLKLLPGEDALTLEAGVGWREGSVGKATVDTGSDSQAGYTLRVNEPVIVEDLSRDTRFSGPPLLREHDVASGVSVVIEGLDHPYGVLGAHSRRPRVFSEHDTDFVQAVANVLGAAIEQASTKEALRESRSRLQAALQAGNIGTWRVDLEAGTDTRDAETNRLFGLPAEEKTYPLDDYFSRVHSDDAEEVEEAWNQALQSGEFDIENRIVREDGTVRWVRDRGEVIYDEAREEDEARTPRFVTGAIIDITDRKEAEEALRNRERQLEGVLKQMPSGLHVVEAPSGKFMLANEEASRLLRHPVHEVEDIEEYTKFGAVHSDGTPYSPDEYPIVRALQGETVHQEEMHYRRGDGTEAFLAVNAAPVRDAEGTIVMAMTVFQDITQLKEYERELEAINRTLEERVDARTKQVRKLASTLTRAEQRERHRISHVLHDDLQQQLYSIQMQLSLLKRNSGNGSGASASSSEPADEANGAAPDGQGNGLNIDLESVLDLIDQSIQTTRQLTVDISPPVLEGEGIVEAVEWMGSQMKDMHRLDVEVEAERQELTVPSKDMRVLLFQLVRELLFNIVKHAEVDKAIVRVKEEDEYLIIEVEDSGKGFEPNQAESKGRFGLSSVVERLKLFDGQFDIHSSPGEGTRCTARIPLRYVEESI